MITPPMPPRLPMICRPDWRFNFLGLRPPKTEGPSLTLRRGLDLHNMAKPSTNLRAALLYHHILLWARF